MIRGIKGGIIMDIKRTIKTVGKRVGIDTIKYFIGAVTGGIAVGISANKNPEYLESVEGIGSIAGVGIGVSMITILGLDIIERKVEDKLNKED